LVYWSHRKLNAQPAQSPRVKAKIYFLNLGKAALAVLHGVLHSALTPSTGLSMEQTGIQPILRLLPVLGTSLDEYDTSSREISLRCVYILLSRFQLQSELAFPRPCIWTVALPPCLIASHQPVFSLTAFWNYILLS